MANDANSAQCANATPIPAFCKRLPQRAAAFQIMNKFVAEQKLEGARIVEQYEPDDNVVYVLVEGVDGKTGCIGYEWNQAQRQIAEAAHV